MREQLLYIGSAYLAAGDADGEARFRLEGIVIDVSFLVLVPACGHGRQCAGAKTSLGC